MQKPFNGHHLLDYLASLRDKQSFEVAPDCQTIHGFTVFLPNWQCLIHFHLWEVEDDLAINIFQVSSSVTSFVSKIRHFEFPKCYL